MRVSISQISKYRLYLHCIQYTLGSGSSSCRVLEETCSIYLSPSLMLHSLLTSSCSFFIWQCGFSTRAHLLQHKKPSPPAPASARGLRLLRKAASMLQSSDQVNGLNATGTVSPTAISDHAPWCSSTIAEDTCGFVSQVADHPFVQSAVQDAAFVGCLSTAPL